MSKSCQNPKSLIFIKSISKKKNPKIRITTVRKSIYFTHRLRLANSQTQHKTSSPLKLQTQHKAYSPFHSTHSFFDFLLPGKKTHKSNIKLEKMIFWQISKKSNCENCCYNFFFSFLTSLGKYWLFFWRIDRAFWKIGFFWVWVRGGILEGSRRPNFQEKKIFPVQTNYTRFSNIFP
jgi:hypothetical protein